MPNRRARNKRGLTSISSKGHADGKTDVSLTGVRRARMRNVPVKLVFSVQITTDLDQVEELEESKMTCQDVLRNVADFAVAEFIEVYLNESIPQPSLLPESSYVDAMASASPPVYGPDSP